SDAKEEQQSAGAESDRDRATKNTAGESEAKTGSAEKSSSDDAEFVPEPPALPFGADDDQGAAKAGGKERKKKYKPLDDNLREQIRDSVINERRKKFLQVEKDKAVEAFRDLGLRFSTSPDVKLTDPKPEELKVIQQRSEEELRRIAGILGMKFI